MKNYLKNYWWSILLLLLPFILNWFVTRNNYLGCEIAGDSKDWLLIWITYFGAIASFSMVFATYKTLMQQKKQWEIEKRPYLNVSIKEYYHCRRRDGDSEDIKNINEYLLVVENYGNSLANDVKINFDEKFVNGITYAKAKEQIEFIMKNKVTILPNRNYIVKLCDSINGFSPQKEEEKKEHKEIEMFLNYFNSNEINITLEYNGYKEETKIITPHNLQMWKTGTVEVLDYIRMSIDNLKDEIKKHYNQQK